MIQHVEQSQNSSSTDSCLNVLEELFRKQKEFLDGFYANFNLNQIEPLISKIIAHEGVVFFSGVGKSGLVAQKIALTMVSTGTRSLFMSPVDAVHGDMGMICSNDVFIMLSKSGESTEMNGLIPAIRNKGGYIVGVVCDMNSQLAKQADITILLPFKSELCPFDMVPSMSTTFQLLFGDLLALSLMKIKKFTLSEYALNHPSGRIGKRITLRVKDLMLTGNKLPICKPMDRLHEILVELSNKRCGCILIVDSEMRLIGIFTDGDLRRALQKHGENSLNLRMDEIMTPTARYTNPDILAWDAMKLMEEDYKRRITNMPVLDVNSKVVGLIQLHDIVQMGL